MVLPNPDTLFSGWPHSSPQIEEWVDCLDSPYYSIKQVFFFFHPGTKLSFRITFLTRKWTLAFHCTFTFLLVPTELSLGTRNILFQGNSMKIDTQMNCEVHILVLEWIFSSLCIEDLLLGTWYENWQKRKLASFQNKSSQECITNNMYYTMYRIKWQWI